MTRNSRLINLEVERKHICSIILTLDWGSFRGSNITVGSLNFFVTFSLTDRQWPHCFGENALDQPITYILYLQDTLYILYSLYILNVNAGVACEVQAASAVVQSDCSAVCVPAGVCAVQVAGTVVQSDCSAIHVCWQVCVQSRPLVL